MRKFWMPYLAPDGGGSGGQQQQQQQQGGDGQQQPPAGEKKEGEQPPAGEKKEPPAGEKKDPPAGEKKDPPAGEKKEPPAGEKKEPEGQQQQQQGPPEKYELKVEKDVALFIDADDLKEIEAVARDKGLTNDQAQSLVDDRVKYVTAQSDKFRAATEADPVIGGDKLEDTLRLAKIGVDKLYAPGTRDREELDAYLKKTGHGNHRIVVKLMRRLGEMQQEDGGPGSTNAAGERKVEELFYGGNTKK